jgi:lipoprotein-anchoring transpeptidase ErfK/SrfK
MRRQSQERPVSNKGKIMKASELRFRNRTHNSDQQRAELTRREFLQLSALGLVGLTLPSLGARPAWNEFPLGERLGRVCTGKWELKARPDSNSATVGVVMDDEVLPWLREVAGTYSPYRINRRWVETPQGYLWAAYLQPVRYEPNQPLEEIPNTSTGPGIWVEVTVPWVDAIMINPPPRHATFKYRYENGLPLRFYYSQILWVDQLRIGADGRVYYRVNEKYGNRGDLLWAEASAFRPLTSGEISPISPAVEDKRIVIYRDLHRQYLVCYEGETEVYYCRISSGASGESTPLGSFRIYRKLMSLHMGGTAVQGIDVVGVGWTCFFTAEGVAIHSTYWHNNFGEPTSSGCINVTPKDALWLFRWVNPVTAYDPGEITVTDFSGTRVIVRQD